MSKAKQYAKGCLIVFLMFAVIFVILWLLFESTM